MADARIRRYSVFLNSKKVAECFKAKTTLNSGDELAYGDDGVIGVTDGAGSLSIDFSSVVPVPGMSVPAPETYILSKQYVTIQVGLINGKTWACSMRFTKAEYDSDSKTGALNGDFTVIGGNPTIS